jgi:acetoin:2,6-dichlorophenolindophenol oxidoreductase subunit beta
VSEIVELTYRDAVRRALSDALESHPDVIVFGEDVAAAGGVFKTTGGLLERFGPRRVRDTPISEQAIVGCALGAALTGLRPVPEIMFADFVGVCFDQIANQLAKYHYMSGGQLRVPVTIRLANGGAVGFAAQHSQSVENWLLNVPGLKLCVPATPADVYGLLRSAILDDNPVLVFEHKALYGTKGPVVIGESPVPLGVADVVCEGEDVTVIATQLMRHRVLEAVDRLGEDPSVEVIDPRTLAPLDLETILASVKKTGRIMCVQESPPPGSWGATLLARIAEEAFEWLDARPTLVAADDTPIPYAHSLEEAWMPSSAQIMQRIRQLVGD